MAAQARQDKKALKILKRHRIENTEDRLSR